MYSATLRACFGIVDEQPERPGERRASRLAGPAANRLDGLEQLGSTDTATLAFFATV